ncbi:LCP family protein [Chloroflexota bacterium]
MVNILLIGLDASGNLRMQNTDVIVVLSFNKDTKQVSMLSIPRDLWVYIPTYGWSRINTTHRWGSRVDYPGRGPGLLMDTIEMHFGIPIDHWARVDFEGFRRVVDELGGVEMSVACPVNLSYRAPSEDQPNAVERHLEPGVYPMDGATALRYVRTRRGGTDFDRARRQHEFLKAMWHQTKDPGIILKIPALWSALADSFDTDLGVGDVLGLAQVALEVKPQRIRSRYIGANQTTGWTNADGWSVLLPDYERIQRVVASLYAPPYAKEDQASNEGAQVRILNGTYRPQLAKIAADDLRWHGLNSVETGPADNPDYESTQIIVYNEKPKAMEVLVEVLEVDPQSVIYQSVPADQVTESGDQPIDIDVILGSDYDPCR